MLVEPQRPHQLIHLQWFVTQIGSDFDVLPHRQVRDQVIHLEDVAKVFAPVAGQLLFPHGTAVFSVDADVPAVRGVNPADDVEKGGLAGAGRPQQHAKLPLVQRKIDPFQYLDTAVSLSESLFDSVNFNKHIGLSALRILFH